MDTINHHRMPTLLALIWNPERRRTLTSAARELGYDVVEATSVAEAVSQLGNMRVDAMVTSLGRSQSESCDPLLKAVRRSRVFGLVYSATANGDPKCRLSCFDSGARMVTNDEAAVREALRRVAAQGKGGGHLTCPTCRLPGLTEDELHLHCPLYHASEPNQGGTCCPVCLAITDKPAVHIHNSHGPAGSREPGKPDFAAFAWVVCRRRSDGKFVMVNEPAGISRGRPGYWLPAGRVDAGETLVQAAEREALEEAGVEVKVEGVLHFMLHGTTMRVVFLARPVDEGAACKTVPDFESVGALWVDPGDLEGLEEADYRSDDPARYFPAVASGRLASHSLVTDTFRALELEVRRLTQLRRVTREDGESVLGCWDQLRAEYPLSAFQEPRRISRAGWFRK